jgi:lipopolysaccharide transport system ATP-binding protein
MTVAIAVEQLSKVYHLGQIGTGTFTNDLKVWWAKQRGLPNPLSRIGEAGPGNREAEKIWALRDVSFRVEQGEVLGIIGRNGAGKSTLLKILSRITAPTRGRVRLKGRIASLLEVGTGFHPELTGRENIYLNGAILGMKRNEIAHKFDEIVDFAEVEKFIDTPVKRYSSGMYVRLAFAVAAHLEPEILVVDEVLAVGDAAFQKKCLGKMGAVAKDGRTVLFVSHNMAAVEALCTKGLVFETGHMAFWGDQQNAIAFYLKSSQAASLRQHGPGWVKRVVPLDQDRNPRSTFQTGEALSFVVDIDTQGRKIKKPVVGLGIDTDMGQRVFTVGTYYSNDELPPINGEARILCEIEIPFLVPGEYFVKAGLNDNFTVLDERERIGSFTIEAGDIFGNGKLPQKNKKHGLIAVRSHWTLIDGKQDGSIGPA